MTYDEATKYPLCWPDGWPRVAPGNRSRSRFGERSASAAFGFLAQEMARMCVEKWLMSCDIPRNTRTGGLAAFSAQPKDTGVSIWFYLAGKPVSLACDKWDRVQDNIWAIAKHVEALRGQDRWGVGTLEQAFRGYMALPGIGESGGIKWWEVLGVPINSTAEGVKEAYRILAKKHHPDVNGDRELWDRVSAAYQLFESSQKTTGD